MISLDTVRDQIHSMQGMALVDGELRVTTQCLYPSNGSVIVTVHGGAHTFVVSDTGRAVEEVRSYGLVVDSVDRHFRRLVRDQGLLVDRGVIRSPEVPAEAVGPAVLLVANASKEAAHWCLSHFKFTVRRNFKQALADLLERNFGQELKHALPIVGVSNKPHKFEHVIVQTGGRQVLIDPVLNDASSINSRVVANLDVKNLNDPMIEQRIVFDDQDRWSASDLALLQMGAPIVPFSRAPNLLRGLRAA